MSVGCSSRSAAAPPARVARSALGLGQSFLLDIHRIGERCHLLVAGYLVAFQLCPGVLGDL